MVAEKEEHSGILQQDILGMSYKNSDVDAFETEVCTFKPTSVWWVLKCSRALSLTRLTMGLKIADLYPIIVGNCHDVGSKETIPLSITSSIVGIPTIPSHGCLMTLLYPHKLQSIAAYHPKPSKHAVSYVRAIRATESSYLLRQSCETHVSKIPHHRKKMSSHDEQSLNSQNDFQTCW